MKTTIRALFIVLAAAVALGGCNRRQPIYRVTDHPIPAAARGLPAATIQQTIMEAAANRGWRVDWKAPGEMTARQAWKEHEAVVEIRYSHESYTIDHVSTTNLLEQGETVHRNYNKLVRALEDEIERRLYQAKR
ncbi:hypothetical protein [Azospirillum sp.]|uniref:hypothetical protein n=1 Tax=Azospirillum sp. TaxID=34012 RepID=UPI003D72DA65